MKISILCPSRNRPENLKRMWQSAVNTSDNPARLEFVFFIDADARESSVATFTPSPAPVPKIIVGNEKVCQSEMWNICQRNANGDVFMLCGDDIVFRSNAWDFQIEKAFDLHSDRIAYVHGEDGYWGDRHGTHGFVHKNWIDTIGYFVPPYFSADYVDTWLTDVADQIGRRIYLNEVVTEHMHVNFGKAPLDNTYKESAERRIADNLAALYASKAIERSRDAEKLRNFINRWPQHVQNG